MYPGQCIFTIHRPSALAIGRSRGKKSWRWAVFTLFSLFLLFPVQPVALSLPPQQSDRAEKCSAHGMCRVRVRGGRRELFVLWEGWDPGASGSSVPLGMKTLTGHPLSPLLSFPSTHNIRSDVKQGIRGHEERNLHLHLFQPSIILKVKHYYKSFILVPIWQNI